MNTEVIGRMMEAKKYQMLAIKALFPEGKQEHIDNIERELKAMFSESMMDCVMKCMSAASDIKAQANERNSNTENQEANNQEANNQEAESNRTADKVKQTVSEQEKNKAKGTARKATVKKEKVHKVTIE